MHRYDSTQTNLAAVADPEEIILREEMEDGDEEGGASEPAPPRPVRLHEVKSSGERVPARAVVGRNASLALEVPPCAARLVVLALDGDGQVIASSDVEIETAMTAEVFLDLIAAGLVTEGLDELDLHVRVTPEVAAALAAAARKARRGPRPLPSVPIATARRRR